MALPEIEVGTIIPLTVNLVSGLLQFNENYLFTYSPDSCSICLTRKTATADGAPSVEEALTLIARYLRSYQLHCVRTTREVSNVVFMPFMFRRPDSGLQLRGNDGILYTIDSLITNPTTNQWEGLLEFDQAIPTDSQFRFSFVLNDGVGFCHEAPGSGTGLTQNSSGAPIIDPPMTPTIVWTVVEREPAAVSGAIGSKPRELRPRIREQYKDPSNSNYTIEVSGQLFDTLVQFDCWSSDALSAARLSDWFEHFLHLHYGIFQQAGLKHLIFKAQKRDGAVSNWRQGMTSNSLQYWMRTEVLHFKVVRDLTNLNVSQTLVTETSSCSPGWVANQFVTGQLTDFTYQKYFKDLNGQDLFTKLTLNDGGLNV